MPGAIAVVAAVAVMASLSLAVFSASTLDGLFREGGVVENAQAILYGLCVRLSLAYWRREVWPGGLTGALLLAVLMLRELDFHKRFTAMSVTRTRYYLLPDVPVLSKVIAASVLLVTLAIAVLFFRKHARFFRNALSVGARLGPGRSGRDRPDSPCGLRGQDPRVGRTGDVHLVGPGHHAADDGEAAGDGDRRIPGARDSDAAPGGSDPVWQPTAPGVRRQPAHALGPHHS